MEKRQRLTTATVKVAENKADGKIPGDVGNENRPAIKIDEYSTFQPTVQNHELPDMRTEWDSDSERNEIGFGEPKTASVRLAAIRIAAENATKLAFLFLGDKAENDVIEEQATDFMKLGSVRLANALKRYADTEELYAEEETEAPVVEAKAEKPVVTEAPVVEAPVVEAPVVEAPVVEAPVEASDEEIPEIEESVEASDEESDELNIELDDTIESEEIDEQDLTTVADEEEFDSELASIFDEENEEEEPVATASTVVAKRQGISKLSNQVGVKTASKKTDADDLAGLWDSTSEKDVF